MHPTNRDLMFLIIPPLWLLSAVITDTAQPAAEQPLGDPIALPEVLVEDQRARGYLPTQTTSGSRPDLPPRDTDTTLYWRWGTLEKLVGPAQPQQPEQRACV